MDRAVNPFSVSCGGHMIGIARHLAQGRLETVKTAWDSQQNQGVLTCEQVFIEPTEATRILAKNLA